MRFLRNLLFLLLTLMSLGNYCYALSNYQIKGICKNQKKKSICIKNLKNKKIDLIKGKRIEIPVIPHKEIF